MCTAAASPTRAGIAAHASSNHRSRLVKPWARENAPSAMSPTTPATSSTVRHREDRDDVTGVAAAPSVVIGAARLLRGVVASSPTAWM